MKNKRKRLLIAALLIIAVVSITTYAIYKSTATGTSGFKAAKWYIELNGTDITTNNTFEFDLQQANWSHNTVIDSDETELVVIAPGSYGTVAINIDASETEIDVAYTLTAVVKQNDTVVDLSTINPNLSLGFYENDVLKDNPYSGVIPAHGTYNGEIRIVWEEIDSTTSNSYDLNINDQDFVVEVTVETSQNPLNIPVCQPATSLHTTTCENASSGCGLTVGNGNTITYGTIVSGRPKAGDAYDCDVNNDEVFDPETERFYYVGSSGNTSTLIYYTNIDNQTMYAYDSSNENWHGPVTGYQYLPSTTDWDNLELIAPGTRQIVAEDGSTSTNGGTIESFTYTDKAARFLTTQELVNTCSSLTTIGNITTGELDGCNWLMENVGYYEKGSGTRTYGYWLETPRSSDSNTVWYINGEYSLVYYGNVDHVEGYGIRPVITLPTANISR